MSSVFHDGVLVDVNVSFWSGSKALNPEDLGLDPKRLPEAYRLGKKFLIPARVVRGFRSVEAKARRVVQENSFKFPMGNARFVPRKQFSKVLGKLEALQLEYMALVEDLVQNYDSHRSEMLPVYRQAAEDAFLMQAPSGVQEFSMDDREKERDKYVKTFLRRIDAFYPASETLRQKFYLGWDVYEISVPKMKKSSTAQIIGEQEAVNGYRDQAKKKLDGFLDDVVTALRAETKELCERVAGNIQNGKVVKSQTLKSINEFIDRFRELNFVGDTAMEEQLNALRKEFLNVHSNEQVAEQSDLQEELGRRLRSVQAAASDFSDLSTITGDYRRKINWQDTPEE